MLNGLSSIATHQYQTSIYAPSVQGQIVYDNYSSFGVLDEAFTFDIPVYVQKRLQEYLVKKLELCRM